MNPSTATIRPIKAAGSLLSSLLLSVSVFSQNSEESSYDEIWNKVVLYENPENETLSKFL